MSDIATRRTKLMAEIHSLTPEDQYKLLEELVILLKNGFDKDHDIKELKGLGKEIWSEVDIDEYTRNHGMVDLENK